MRTMKVLHGDRGHVDFGGPVTMSQEEREKFIEFLESLFCPVEVEEADQERIDRLGDKKMFFPEWTPEEYVELRKFDDEEELAERLGRTPMAVRIKRGSFLPKYMRWAEERGHDLVKENPEELVREYLAEKGQLKEKRKEMRKKKKELQEELDRIRKLEERIEESSELLELAEEVGVIGEDNYEKLEGRKRETIDQLSSCEEFLENVKTPKDFVKWEALQREERAGR